MALRQPRLCPPLLLDSFACVLFPSCLVLVSAPHPPGLAEALPLRLPLPQPPLQVRH